MNNEDVGFCKYFNFTQLLPYNIGFSVNVLPFMTLPFLSFVLNILIIVLYFSKLRYLKGQ